MNKWDKRIPVEQSAYVSVGEPIVIKAKRSNGNPKYAMVDLFSGCGGFSVGFRNAGFSPILGIDHLEPAIKTYVENHPTASAILGDIKDVSAKMLHNVLGGRKVYVVTAGVPCQGFSLMNRKKWDGDERNFLFKEFIRIIRIIKPEFVLLENVLGMRMTDNGSFVRQIMEAIRESGYRVDFHSLKAQDYGVPQSRERVFFLGAKRGLGVPWPEPQFGPGRKFPYQTVSSAIGDLPPLAHGESTDKYSRKPKTDYQKKMRRDCKTLFNHEAPSHTKDVLEMIEKTAPGEPMYERFAQRIRLHPDKLSPTQIAGGIRPQFTYGHPTQVRGLTVRERCRIQSFPDDFHILGGIVQGRVQTGNAVPPLLAEVVAKEIRKYIENDYRPKQSASRKAAHYQMESFEQERFPLEGF